jgi:aspartate aminotransferase-like enzyme
VTCCVPDGVRFQDLYERLKRRGYLIYACKDVLAERFMQVANMGDLPGSAIDDFLAAIAEIITQLRAEASVRLDQTGQLAAFEPVRAAAAKRSSRY